jgi:hypothetical protein
MSTSAALHPIGEASLRQILVQVHQFWWAEVRRHVGPVTAPHAGFRERWAAVLYLTDRFEHGYGLECEVLGQLRDRLDAGAAGRLERESQTIDDLRADFEWLGRTEGTAPRAATIGRSLLLALRRWWSEIEQAVSGLRSEELSPESGDLLRELHTAFGPAPSREAAQALPVSGRLTSVEINRPQARS